METFIHNRKKKYLLKVINLIIEVLWLPGRVFTSKVDLKGISARKILVSRLDHIGDVVMTSPSLRALRNRFPESEILLLTNTTGNQLYGTDPVIDRVFVFNWPWPYQKKKERFTVSKIKELFTLIRKLRKEKIDIFIDFRGDIRFIVLFGLLTGSRLRISSSRSGKTSLLHNSSTYDVSKHEVERSLDIVKCFGPVTSEIRPRLFLTADEIRDIKQLVSRETGIVYPARLAVIAPYSSKDVKSWPGNYFREVISHLLSKDCVVIIAGAADNKNDAENMIAELDGNVYSLAGKTSVRQAAALVSISDIVVGVDTGVLHLASCFDVPVLAIFGSTRAVEFRPYSPYATVIDMKSCECNQFLHLKCDHQVNGYAKCLQMLPPSSVIMAIDQVLTGVEA